MFILPKNRDNVLWGKINSQFLKGGFAWYGKRNPSHNNWYYLYYINEGEKCSCKQMSKYKKWNKVTCWLRHIEKFEEIHKNYKKKITNNSGFLMRGGEHGELIKMEQLKKGVYECG